MKIQTRITLGQKILPIKNEQFRIIKKKRKKNKQKIKTKNKRKHDLTQVSFAFEPLCFLCLMELVHKYFFNHTVSYYGS